MLHLLFALITSAVTFANVQQAQCISPRGRPAKAASIIYLHGWFPGQGGGGYVSLEAKNRRKLQELADLTGETIAVPVSQKFNRRGYRSWSGYGGGAGRLAAAESLARRACGQLAVPRKLIGFSDGGYAARSIGLECAAKRAQYSMVVMTGASPQGGGVGGRECAPLVFTGGRNDGTTRMAEAAAMVRNLRNRGREASTWPAYAGGHDIPSGSEMARLFGTNNPRVAEAEPAPAVPIVPTTAARPAPPIPRPTVSHGSSILVIESTR